MTRAVAEADQFIFAGNLSSEIEAAEFLERGEAAAVLVIPKNFARNFYSQQPVELAFLQDGENIVPVNYSLTPINLIAGNFAARYNQLAAASNSTPTLSPKPVGITLAFGLSVQADAARFSTPRVLLAKEIFYLALSLISLAAIFALPFRGDMWRMLTICAIFLFTAENLAGLLALFFKTELALVRAMVFYTLPSLTVAGNDAAGEIFVSDTAGALRAGRFPAAGADGRRRNFLGAHRNFACGRNGRADSADFICKN